MGIPAFKARSDFATAVLSFSPVGTSLDYRLSPSMFEHSRWLLIRTWSGKVSSKNDKTQIGIGDTKVKISCSRVCSIRPMPQHVKPDIHASPKLGLDAFGSMAPASDFLVVTDENVARIDEADDDVIMMANAAAGSV